MAALCDFGVPLQGECTACGGDGDYEYLKILDNTFLFNVVEDPMERANLKVRHKDVYDRPVSEWYEWNAAVLPEIDESSTGSFTGDQLADLIGAPRASGRADIQILPRFRLEGRR